MSNLISQFIPPLYSPLHVDMSIACLIFLNVFNPYLWDKDFVPILNVQSKGTRSEKKCDQQVLENILGTEYSYVI